MTKKKKLPRLPNKIKGATAPLKKDWTPEEIAIIKATGSEQDKEIVAKLSELGGDTERLLHVQRLKMRGLSRTEIAAALGFSVATIEKDISAINKQIRIEVLDFDYPLFIGQSVAFYDEVRNSSMVIAANEENSEVIRLGAYKTAMAAETNKINLLARVGLFDNQSDVFNPESAAGEERTDGDDFRDFIEELWSAVGKIDKDQTSH